MIPERVGVFGKGSLGCCKIEFFVRGFAGVRWGVCRVQVGAGSRLQNGVFLLGCKMVLFAGVCGGCLSVFWATAANAAE